MRLLDYWEKDKTALTESLLREQEGEKVSRTLEKELDQLLLQYNESCENALERNAAAAMVNVLRLAVPLVDTVGETRVWERSAGSGKPARKGKAWKIWMAAGGVCLAAVLCLGGGILIPALQTEKAGVSPGLLLMLAVSLAGSLLCLYQAGKSSGKVDKAGELRVEVQTDGKKVLRQFQTALLGMDQSLEEFRLEDRARQEDEKIQSAEAADPASWDFFAGLLEAAYSRDGDYALDQLKTVRHYLHRQGVELADYTETNRQMFDVMPSSETRTLRPAIVQNGKVLKKGLAGEAVN